MPFKIKPKPIHVVDISEEQLLELGLLEILSRRPRSKKFEQRLFIAHFGCRPCNALIVWKMLHSDNCLNDIKNPDPLHFLWMLLFLKLHPKVDVMEMMYKKDRKTIKK